MTEVQLKEETVRAIAVEQLEILGRYVPEIDARLASELRNRLSAHFIVTSYVLEGQCVFRCIATRHQWSCLLRIEDGSWLRPEVAASMSAPETKRPAEPKPDGSSVARKKRQRSR